MLAQKNIISQYELQTAENTLAQQKANLAQAEAQLINAEKTCPTRKFPAPRMELSERYPIVSVVSLAPVWQHR